MKTQNVTLAVPKDILHELKLLTTKQEMSLSRYVINLLAEEVSGQKEYEDAMCRNMERLGKYNLGTEGKIPWTRD